MGFFDRFGLPAKLNTALLLLTIAVIFVLTQWLGVPPTSTLFFGAGILFVAAGVVITGLVSVFKQKPPKQRGDGGADA